MLDCSKLTSRSALVRGCVGLGVGVGFLVGFGVFGGATAADGVGTSSSAGGTDAGARGTTGDEAGLLTGKPDGAVDPPGPTDVHALTAATRMPAASIRITAR